MKPCPSVLRALAKLDTADAPPSLRVVFPGNTAVSRSGIQLPKLAAKDTPALSVSTSLAQPREGGHKYIAVCIDLDAPFPSFSILGPIIHWIQTDLVAAAAADDDGFTRLETSARPAVPYAPPGPPPPSGPHRYVFMLWEQPASLTGADEVSRVFSLPAEPGLTARIRWDQGAFEEKMGLGEPLAVNYFVADSR
ncbi:protease inhibitor (Tfs1) [Cordyceps militaris]|uniref:Protease inhibitor (Tfs1) n=1 Tax=Cordyceps militaris TaxID=73501 RepID=A0A2H4S9E2_CORMI|nr:protease inhibitor (Tfs1) [Cordyceps militaris]